MPGQIRCSLASLPMMNQAIAELVHRAVQECDFVITSGGASAGDYDYVTALVRREGEVLFDRISMRPGKAITFGLLGGKPYLGLSGNPAAAYVGFEMLVRPAIRKMRGFAEGTRPVQQAILTHGRGRSARIDASSIAPRFCATPRPMSCW